MSSNNASGHSGSSSHSSGNGQQQGTGNNLPWDAERVFAHYAYTSNTFWEENDLRMPPHHSEGTQPRQTTAPLPVGNQPVLSSHNFRQSSWQPVPASVPQYLFQEGFSDHRDVGIPITFATDASVPYVLLRNFSGSAAHWANTPLLGGDESIQNHGTRFKLRPVGFREPYTAQLDMAPQGGRWMTKRELVQRVAGLVYDFMGTTLRAPIGTAPYTVGPGTAGFDRVVLYSLRNVAPGEWQAVLGVLPSLTN